MERSKMTLLLYAAVTAAVVIAGHGVSSSDQSFAVEPEDMSAVVNTSASLPCRVADLAGQLQWTKDDFALGTNRNLSYHGYPRYAMIGNDGNGEYNLKLNPVTLDDDGVYQCQVGTGKRDEPAIRSRKATLTVLVPPGRPRIARTYADMPTENVPIELVCVSDGAKPPAEITWADDSGTVIEEGVQTYIEAWESDSRRFTTRSVLKLVPKMEHHNTSIWCRAHNAAIDKKLQTKINLQVKFAPKISLVMAGSPKRLVEGSDVQFLCLTKANPPEVTYRWFVNDQYAPSEVTRELWLINITRRLHNSQVRCEAQNVVDKTEESKTLSISYKPQFKSRPKNVQADAGHHVTIMCDVDSNPPAAIEWSFERTKKVVSTSSNLTVIVSAATAGRYHCKATTAGFGEVSANVIVHMKRAPVIISPRVQHGTPSDTVHMECIATSVPVPDRIVWTYHGTIIGTRNDQNSYSVLEDPTDEGVKSTLIIRNSKHEQFGAYNCTASNDYGSDSVEIALVPKRDIMMILAIMGAVGGIIVIIMIFCVITFCRRSTSDKKKKAKTEFGAESDCTDNKQAAAAKESDSSSNVSDIKMETGTGSSLSNYRYKIDYGSTGGGADSMTITTTLDDQRRSTTPKSGGGGSQTTLTRGGGGGIPLAGPVPVDPRYTTVGGSGVGGSVGGGYLGHQHNVMHHPLSNGTVVNDYTDPLNYVSRYNNHNHNSINTDRPTSTSSTSGLSNGYIAADRLYDLNPAKMTSSVSAHKLQQQQQQPTTAELITRNGGDTATLLQYSAAYGNPFLRPNSVHWPPVAQKLDAYGRPEPPPYSSVKNQQQQQKRTKNVAAPPSAVAAAQQVPGAGPNYMHIGVAKRQTLATHV